MGDSEQRKGAKGDAGRDSGGVKAPSRKSVINLENYSIEIAIGGKWYHWGPRGFKDDTISLSADGASRLARLPVGKHFKIGG